MSTKIGVKIGLCVATLIVFGGMFAALTAVQADDVPITVGKPIIKPDPPKPPKKDSVVVGTMIYTAH